MSKRPVEVRCPSTLDIKGREIRCGRFLAEISDEEIRIPCPKCGNLHSIIRDDGTKRLRIQTIPKASALISKKDKE